MQIRGKLKLMYISLSQQAYENIKQKIVSLEMSPGSIIDEVNLQEDLGLGRTPIREALKRLALEKLVVIAPRRGMFVSEIGIRDLQQLFEMRLPLESLAARLAAERGTEEQWQRMAIVLAELPEAAVENQALIAIDEACHEIIYEATENEFLKDTLVTHYALSQRLWYYFLSKIGDMRDALLDHIRVLEALQAKDADKAARLMERHIRTFQEEIQLVMIGSALPANVFGQNMIVKEKDRLEVL
jgi:DNA-binding GntR family transcriptional regulator